MNNKKQNLDLSVFNCSLNFAFCPSIALSIKDNFLENKKFDDLVKEFPNQDRNDLLSALRYFYICYSFKVDNAQFENQEYFYFQIFSKIAGHLNPENPIYGFFDKEKVTSMIQEINEMFDPQNHDKIILDPFGEDFLANANEMIVELQKWTELKLLDFNKDYFLNNEVLNSLAKMIENEKKNSACKKKKKVVKTQPKDEKTKPKRQTKRRAIG